MAPNVLILYTRHDAKSAAVVEWMKSTLNAAGMSCDLSEEVDTDAARRASLVIVPLSDYKWIENRGMYARAATSVGVPILAVPLGEIPPVSWGTLETSGALRNPLTLTDTSKGSAARLIAAAWAAVDTTRLELTVAIFASTGLENELRQVLTKLTEVANGLGNRVSFRPLIWPISGSHIDAYICLMWHDLRNALDGNDFAINEWQSLETPSVLLFYRERLKDTTLGFDERLARLRQQKFEADAFIEGTLGLRPGTPTAPRGRSKAGNPPANFDRQLREYLVSRVEAFVKRTNDTAQAHDHTDPEQPLIVSRENDGVPSRFRNPSELRALMSAERRSVDLSSRTPIEPPRDAVSQAHFAAFSPDIVEPGRSFLLEIWACPRGAYADMLKMAIRREGISLRGSKLAVAPPAGTVCEVSIDLPSFVAAESKDTLLWTGEPTNASFVMTPQTNIPLGWHTGTATISVGDVPFARLRFEIQAGRAMTETRDVSSNEERVSSIFASYASANRLEVLQWARGAEVAGVRVFLDVLSLRESTDWESELLNIVPASDLFCLFWSAPAKQSIWVEREWRCALAARGLNYIHPVPLEDPREVPPPVELTSRHFGDPAFFVQQYEKLRRHLGAGPAVTEP
jgi:hypothetical protein